jgi:tetratricopeptide (TPR) repeat protein
MFELEPNSALALYDIAVALHRAGRLTEAINFYRKALAISPNYSDAKEFLAQAERQSREGNNPAH